MILLLPVPGVLRIRSLPNENIPATWQNILLPTVPGRGPIINGQSTIIRVSQLLILNSIARQGTSRRQACQIWLKSDKARPEPVPGVIYYKADWHRLRPLTSGSYTKLTGR